jgi:hypothetical protein
MAALLHAAGRLPAQFLSDRDCLGECLAGLRWLIQSEPAIPRAVRPAASGLGRFISRSSDTALLNKAKLPDNLRPPVGPAYPQEGVVPNSGNNLPASIADSAWR